jgi:hypothetical protein
LIKGNLPPQNVRAPSPLDGFARSRLTRFPPEKRERWARSHNWTYMKNTSVLEPALGLIAYWEKRPSETDQRESGGMMKTCFPCTRRLVTATSFSPAPHLEGKTKPETNHEHET